MGGTEVLHDASRQCDAHAHNRDQLYKSAASVQRYIGYLIFKKRTLAMAIIRRTAVLLAVVVLAGLARNVAARSVPTEEEYVIHTDESEVRIDINGPWGVEMDYDMDFGDSRSKRRELLTIIIS